MSFTIDTNRAVPLSPYVFGHNLEHTRSAVNGGLSAEMLRNRKFAGKPARNSGVAAEWRGIGIRAFFQNDGGDVYTRHIGCERMMRRNELQSQSVQNIDGGLCGIAQDGLRIAAGTGYEIRTVTKCSVPVTLAAELTDRSGDLVYARRELSLLPGAWQENAFVLTPTACDGEASVRFVFSGRAEVVFGALSMMAEGHFRGMRSDVIRKLKEIGPALIRWPGGNFAGEYRWKDGLLPRDMRGPLQAATEIETQPHSHGYDFHEISTDDFLALCREVGAEPFLTINLFWNSPEDSADWVEYVNGPADSPYGRKRAENGHPEPYRVRFWSLGNEMGYGHMEGPMRPEDYAALAEKHIEAMRAVAEDLVFFSSGPYPSGEWAERSAARLSPAAPYVSLHHYSQAAMDYSSPAKAAETYRAIVGAPRLAEETAREMRRVLDGTDRKMMISFDEWNFWYAWYRPSSVAEGIYTAKMLHMLLRESGPLNMPVCCYFQPVNEGALILEPGGARLTANGQVFSLMKAHRGGSLCAVSGTEADDGSVLATVKEGILTVTLVNDAYDLARDYGFRAVGDLSGGTLLSSGDIAPGSFFDESPLPVRRDGDTWHAALPPHSAARITLRLP